MKRRTTSRKLGLAVALVAMSAGCGSTVQLSSAGSSADGALGLSGVTSPTGGSLQSSAIGTSTGRVEPGGVTGSPTSAGTTEVPTSGQSSAVAPSAGSTERVSIPGVSATAIRVGVIAADPAADQSLESAGFGAASMGNEPEAWKAVADEVNSTGGVAGRKLNLDIFLVNLTDPPAVQGQKACAHFTQDTTVAVVLSGYYYASAHTCLSQKGVPALLGTNYGVDSKLARESGTVVAWATPLLDRLATLLPDAYQRLGRLKSGTAAGIFVTDAPAFTRSAARLASELTRRGVKVTTQTVTDSDTGDYSAATGDASAAVLRFRSAKVTEILFLTHNAFEPTLFMQSANSQGYTPTYLLSTQQYPATLVGLVPARQLQGALALGWAPAVDLASGYATSRAAKNCLATMKKHGRPTGSGTQTLVALLACDGVDLLKRTARQPGALRSRDAFQRTALSDATGFVSSVTFRVAFAGGRRDGVAAYRPMAFSGGCTCFSYTGAVTTW